MKSTHIDVMNPSKTTKTIWNGMTEIVHKTACNMGKRVDACVAERGGHFQRLL
jgi:hypothetical protein